MFSKSFSQMAGWLVWIWKMLLTPCLFIMHTKSILNLCCIKSTKMLLPPFANTSKAKFYFCHICWWLYLQRRTRGECLGNVHKTVSLLASLGFTIHKEKPVLEPTQCIEFLGFLINSAEMAVKINPKKSQIIIEKIKNFLDHKKPKTRQLASVIGSYISLFPAHIRQTAL